MPGAKVNLLIVDDEPSARTTFSRMFTEFGYSVRSAEDASAALVEIRQGLPDILLADLYMPGISGFELLSTVRDRFPAIQVIAMSGDFSGIFIPAGVCADAFYEKGSRPGHLLQIVEAMSNGERPSFLQHPGTSAPACLPRNGHDPSGRAHLNSFQPGQRAAPADVRDAGVSQSQLVKLVRRRYSDAQ